MNMMRVPSGMPAQHDFSRVPGVQIPRSTFNRSHGVKTTFNAGWLVPFYLDEVLPGDSHNVKFTGFARLSTPLFPFMDNVYLDTHFFFVPTRLLWSNWERFNGEQDNPTDSTDFLIPTITSPSSPSGYQPPLNWNTPTANELRSALYDYMGIPIKVPGLVHSALPLRAYNKIFNDWYRDQNLQVSAVRNTGNGPDNWGDYTLRRRGKRHDYFTSALPWPQKGPSVDLPLGTTAPVLGLGVNTAVTTSATNTLNRENGWVSGSVTYPNSIDTSNTGNIRMSVTSGVNPSPLVFADLTNATAATINQLRQAFQIQRMYERDARGGSRYTEIIRSHFGVVSDDARLQRPEYLGGGTSNVVINPVAQTSAVTGQPTPQGNLAAIGTVVANGHGFTKSFTEHGYILGILSVRADLSYQQGLNRLWSRRTRFDFFWPSLAHIGEQTILNKEIFAVGSANLVQDDAVFGYQERYAEYRYKPSQITGQFRSNANGGALDTWHLAQNFASLPLLNSTFIEENPPIQRVVAVQTAPHFIMDGYFQVKSARPMPVYSVPGMIDHF